MPQSDFSSLRIGTRGSRLALVQARIVADALAAANVPSDIVVVKTTGDRIQDRPLADAGGKGLFTKELEEALASRIIDLAVHSMKDVPAQLPDAFSLAAVLKREDPRDGFLARGVSRLKDLPKGASIGTSSVRRAAQVARLHSGLKTVTLRGNVDTRLAKLERGEFDAMLLAVAGLKRLGLQDRISEILPDSEWLPAPAQGAIGIEIRADDKRTRAVVGPLNHASTALAIAAERGFLAALDASCRTPVGALARFGEGELRFRGEVLALDGSDFVDAAFSESLSLDDVERAHRLGFAAGEKIRPRAAAWLDM